MGIRFPNCINFRSCFLMIWFVYWFGFFQKRDVYWFGKIKFAMKSSYNVYRKKYR